jgi:hypothetical protein
MVKAVVLYARRRIGTPSAARPDDPGLHVAARVDGHATLTTAALA